jgi:hypothetical protein
VPADLARAPRAAPRRAAFLPAHAGRPLERAQLVWQRALESASPPVAHDRFALALDLLRAAHHSPATLLHALTLGTAHLHAHPDDSRARGGVGVLEAAIACLGVKPGTGDIVAARR